MFTFCLQFLCSCTRDEQSQRQTSRTVKTIRRYVQTNTGKVKVGSQVLTCLLEYLQNRNMVLRVKIQEQPTCFRSPNLGVITQSKKKAVVLKKSNAHSKFIEDVSCIFDCLMITLYILENLELKYPEIQCTLRSQVLTFQAFPKSPVVNTEKKIFLPRKFYLQQTVGLSEKQISPDCLQMRRLESYRTA